jgi:hypothetical protein
MTPENQEQLKLKLIQQIVGGVSFAEIVKILHELATREVEHQLSEATEEQKQEIYDELFNPEMQEEAAPAP